MNELERKGTEIQTERIW